MPKAQPAVPLHFSAALKVEVPSLVERLSYADRLQLLDDMMTELKEHYFRSWEEFTAKPELPPKAAQRAGHLFRGAQDYFHPLYNGRWATEEAGDHHATIKAQFNRALKANDWQEVMMLAGMLAVRETLYGRATAPQLAPKPKATAKPKKKAAPKAKRAARSPTATATTDKDKLAALVKAAKPLFKANPELDRAGLVEKIGRAYERLTTFAELRTLCAGKTVTTHSMKKSKPSIPPPVSPSQAQPWPFATTATPAKPKRLRRDPARPAELPQSSIPQGVRTKPWPQPDALGGYSRDQAEHIADFGAGAVACDFAAIETENGWTYGGFVKIKGLPEEYAIPLHQDGKLAPDADTAIHNITADLLPAVRTWLKSAETPQDEADKALLPHAEDLGKLRSWLLGFQARGVEKIKFLRAQAKGPQESLELTA